MDDVVAQASAPGKLFLFGEYGVLAGGTCVVCAVDRRVHAKLLARGAGYRLDGASLDDATALPEAVISQLGPHARAGCQIDRLATDVGELYETTDRGMEKLGLGSSAASAVALTAACIGDDTGSATEHRQRVFEHAFAAHRRLQGGRGSGADIAASCFGGVVGYRLLDTPQPFSDLGLASRFEPTARFEHAELRAGLSVPPDLRIEPIWLGRPAKSTSFVGRCEQALGAHPDAVAAQLAHIGELADAALEALVGADARALIELVAQADDALDELGSLIEAPIVTDAHRRLRAHGAGCGVRVKPSGAGGGDFSLAVGPTEAGWRGFLDGLPEGLRHIPLAFGANGHRRAIAHQNRKPRPSSTATDET
jgi:phosphomevalonate kinase